MTQQAPRRIHSDVQTIGELLRKPIFYKVPINQRDFAWTSEEIDILWEDITSALLNGRNEYFLGAIVVSASRDNKACEIVDGQQRLAVISMIFAAIVNEWKMKKDDKRAEGVFRDYLGSEDRRTGELITKLSLNETNNPVFQSVVLKDEKISIVERKSWPLSNKLLDAASNRIKSKVHGWINEVGDSGARLLDLEEFLSNNTNAILIEVGDESDAFVIFETLNDRGLELAVSDLVKNYLFSFAGANLERFKKLWTEITLLVGGENLTPFLRHFWLSEHEIVRERELYRTLRNTIRNATACREFIERLRKVADLYAAILNPEHAYWSEFPPDARNYLDALLLFKVTQFRPVALASMDTFKPNEVTKVLHMLMVISFRYTVVSALGTGNLERIYADAALAIRNGQAKSPAKLFTQLKQAYVADDRFVDDFATRSFSKAPIARYILAELNDHLEHDPEKMVAEKAGRITLEHILPKNINKEWKDAIPAGENHDDYVDRIGNLTLLEKGRNKGISSVGYKEKRAKAFSTSTLSINRELLKHTMWTTKEIDDRSQRLANTAGQVWHVDY
ncbi:MAG: hypothetical protein ILNGONEN_01623 [Syntrophorhabdaceae bacterium]|nr:hypothetical protein [Syntrophorhabdaceae bacterium]